MKINHAYFSILLLSLLLGCLGQADDQIQVIYGTDGRKDLIKENDPRISALADSVLAMVAFKEMKKDKDDRYHLNGQTLGKAKKLCAGEAFADQPQSADCTGFLVADNVLVTAGHCVNEVTCKDTAWIVGYQVQPNGQTELVKEARDVYSCARIIQRQFTTTKQDYAVIQLDRPVAGARPLKMRTQKPVATGGSVFVIGFPMGIPLKVAGGATVRYWDSSNSFFVANLDSFGGNSGSPVFNEQTLEVEGILVRGDDDLTKNGSCYVEKRCSSEGGTGEDVVNISFVSDLFSKSN